MTVSNIQRMLESSKVEGGGSVAVVESTYASVVRSPEGVGGGATPEED